MEKYCMARYRNAHALWLAAGLALALSTGQAQSHPAPPSKQPLAGSAVSSPGALGAHGAAAGGGDAADTALIERLQRTRAANIGDIIAGQFEDPVRHRGFTVGNPYLPRFDGVAPSGPAGTPAESADGSAVYNETVHRWQAEPAHRTEVCALRFLDGKQYDYELKSFASPAAAQRAGFEVTHQYPCGACSSLRDLAVYLGSPDLTTPARQCARKLGAQRIKRCYQESIGLSAPCAESWTYNSLNTRDACLGACVETYGLLNLIFNRYPAGNNRPDGSLNACLACDEARSGPGFKYSAGRTRRGSGINSAIGRRAEDVFPVDHALYFEENPQKQR
jgi:hypothetical protein